MPITAGNVARVLYQRFLLARRDRWSRQELLEHQAKALKSLRKHVYARSPFYRKFHHGLTNRPLEELPILTKATVM